MRFRHMLIKWVTPLVWWLFPQRKISALQEFAHTELDSGWQSLYAMTFVPDPKVRAALFRHALEEFHHSDAFSSLLNSYANAPLNTPVFTREAIIDGKDRDAVLDFLVQVHVGEKEINEDFAVYSEADVDLDIRRLFSRIKVDEEGHEDASLAMLREYAGGDRFRLLRMMWRQSFRNGYKRYVGWSQAMGNVSLGMMLSAVYFSMGPVVTMPLRKRLALSRQEQLEILRRQTRDIKLGAEV